MAELTETPLTDTSDMIAVHKIFRKALSDAPSLVGDAPAGDAERIALVASYYDNILRLLKAHHDGEEELIWPKLRERCPADAEMIDRMEAQHGSVIPAMEVALASSANWSGSADAYDANALATALAKLEDALVSHLDDEEAEMLPLCAGHITQPEWAELPGHSMAHFDGDKPWLIFGLVLDNMTPVQRDHVMASMPPPALTMWASQGSALYQQFASQLAGSAT